MKERIVWHLPVTLAVLETDRIGHITRDLSEVVELVVEVDIAVVEAGAMVSPDHSIKTMTPMLLPLVGHIKLTQYLVIRGG